MLIGIKLELIEEGKAYRVVTIDDVKEMCEKYDMIWGGEINLKMEHEKFNDLIKEYIKEIYA